MSANPWRPISTAPKDGTVIFVPGGIAHWYDGAWYSLTGQGYPGRRVTWTPLHWMPLPAPPAETDQ